MWPFKKKTNIEQIVKQVNKKELFKRYLLLFCACLIVAFAFNMFFLKYGIVCFGVSGLSIVLNEFGVNPSLFILIANIILLIISYFTLGKNKTKNSIVGSIMFPICVYLTGLITNNINIDGTEMIVIAIFGAVIAGFGYGLVYKTGFTTGGTDIINQIISKYSKTSIGNAMLITDGLIVLSGKIVFTWEIVMCGIIVLYIISILTDKVMLGVSQSKAFYIITDKETEIKKYLLSLINGGVTLINVEGGYSNDKKTLILCVIPTRSYYLVKEGLKAIDKNIFFLATDAYEVGRRIQNETIWY